jgi:hypothetical protein
MKVAIFESNEEILQNGLCLADEAVGAFPDGKTKNITTSLINIAKVGAQAMQLDLESSELIKESLDILEDGPICVCPNNAEKFLTFGIKVRNIALCENSEETLQNGLFLIEEALSTIPDDKGSI